MKTHKLGRFKVTAVPLVALAVVVALFVTSLGSAPTAQAHGVVDQASPSFPASNSGDAFNDGNFGSIFQQFTPSVSPLVAADILVAIFNPDRCPADFTVKIRSGSTAGPVLGEETLSSVTPGGDFDNPVLFHFDFTPQIAVVTGNVHYIEASTTTKCAGLHRNDGVVVFRTFGPGPPVGGVAVDPDLGAGALEAQALETPEASGGNAGILAGIVAAAATGVLALGGGALGAAWYARRRVHN